jgi:hypothetical protein
VSLAHVHKTGEILTFSMITDNTPRGSGRGGKRPGEEGGPGEDEVVRYKGSTNVMYLCFMQVNSTIP